MMEYEIFKAVVEENFKDYLPQEYKDADVSYYTAKKTNQTLDAVSVNMHVSGVGVVPIIYINDLYQEYLQEEDWRPVVEAAVKRVVYAIEDIPDEVKQARCLKDPEYVKAHIIACLVNTQKNQELLAGVPHRDFTDLSAMYRIVIDMNDEKSASAVVTNTLAKSMDFTEEDLYAYAALNNKDGFEPFVVDLQRVVNGMDVFLYAGEKGIDELDPYGINVIRNKLGLYGANVMLDKDFLSRVAERYGSDYYILPSSIHEVITISTDFGVDPEALRKMVTEINADVVETKDFLSDTVYRYDREQQQVVVA